MGNKPGKSLDDDQNFDGFLFEKNRTSEIEKYNDNLFDLPTICKHLLDLQNIFKPFYSENFQTILSFETWNFKSIFLENYYYFQCFLNRSILLIKNIEKSSKLRFQNLNQNIHLLVSHHQIPTFSIFFHFILLSLMSLFNDFKAKCLDSLDPALIKEGCFHIMIKLGSLFCYIGNSTILEKLFFFWEFKKIEDEQSFVVYNCHMIKQIFNFTISEDQLDSSTEHMNLFINFLKSVENGVIEMKIDWNCDFINLLKRFVRSPVFSYYGKCIDSVIRENTKECEFKVQPFSIGTSLLTSHMDFLIDKFLENRSFNYELSHKVKASNMFFGYFCFNSLYFKKNVMKNIMQESYEAERANWLMSSLHELIHLKLNYFCFNGDFKIPTTNISPFNRNIKISDFEKRPESGRSCEVTCFGFSCSYITVEKELALIILDENLWMSEKSLQKESKKLFSKKQKVGNHSDKNFQEFFLEDCGTHSINLQNFKLNFSH